MNEIIVDPVSAPVSEKRKIDPCVIILFGATGDLTHRKLVPAFYELARDGNMPERFAIIGVARREKSDEEFRAGLRDSLEKQVRGFDPNDPLVESFLSSIEYHRCPFDDEEGYRKLGKKLEAMDRDSGTGGNRLFYLATAPEHFASVTHTLHRFGLTKQGPLRGIGETPKPWARIVVEKPFGTDLASAVDLNQQLLEVLDESQIYRIDHYLGKETVQNILAFRFSNGIFEPIWNRANVDHVQITVAESIGVGSRGPYYDGAGALRDMVQNHMMQLLSLVAMEPPASMDADAVRDEKVKVLHSLRPMSKDDVRQDTVRAQYEAGMHLGESVPGYLEEDRVPRDSTTPTFTALRVFIDNWRWAGVPFLLRHGKRLPRRVTEIAIQFRTPPMRLFEQSGCAAAPNTLALNIQPDEGISLCFASKIPGPDIKLGRVKMDFRYGSAFGEASPEAYERLLLDALLGDSTLFTRRDEVEASWRYMDRLLETWKADGKDGLATYPAGTWGPYEAERLTQGTEGSWRKP